LRHIQQPEGSSLCGHSCIAMALGLTLDQAVELIGHKRGVRNHEVIRALGSRALTRKSVSPNRLTDPCLIRIKGPTARWHLVLYQDQKVYDPAYSVPAPTLAEWEQFLKQTGWRIVSVFPLRPKDALDNGSKSSIGYPPGRIDLQGHQRLVE
jgi:hypothetical protein